ncbi:FHA domain-containing protein [Paludisphaera rhizosphaerae]|uniref:FHA domain-containing protein n=1 Tax=Paludisphaera rhizosphaerae TaxID=2711216 RepID=UPI00197EC3A0|nr:FHA domain-containing protein [Paludisphaera rhizosphaerae]
MNLEKRSSEPFLAACGAAEPLRLLVEVPGEYHPREIVLPGPFAVVGRDPQADVYLNHPQVSMRHAYLQVAFGRLFWFDLGSRTGTVGCSGSRPAGRLVFGDRLGIGPFILRLAAATDPAVNDEDSEGLTPLSSRFVGKDDLPSRALEIRSESRGSSVHELQRLLTLVGRSPICRICLSDATVSRAHCSLVLTPHGLWVVDLLGRGGTAVDGDRVRFSRLDAGDTLSVGSLRLRVRDDAAPCVEGPFSIGADITPGVLAPSEALIAPLIQQFGQMQDQMFDQFRSLLVATFQMFGKLQRDQIDFLRSELDQIRRLSEEVAEIKADRAGASRSLTSEPRQAQAVQSPRSRNGHRPQPKPLDPQVHSLLDRRIAAMEQESQDRWSSLVQTLLGGSCPPRV